MIAHHLEAVLERVANWPEERQQELAELVVQIEAEMSDGAYQASDDELKASDEGLAGPPSSMGN